MAGRQEHESGRNLKNPEKTLENHLTSGVECGILSELQESSPQVEAMLGKSKVPKEPSEKT